MWKKRLLPLLLAVLLTGCAAKERTLSQKALDLRTGLMEAGGCTFTAAVTADLGGRVYPFTLDCAVDLQGETTLTVVEPEAIQGITASVSQDGATVEFDGAALDFGALAGGNLAPMTFPWHLGQCLQSGYISAAGQDGALEKVTYLVGYGEEAMTFEIWLDEGGLPVHCEVLYDGARCLTADITGFQWKA